MLKTVKDFSREQIHGIAWRYATSGFELSHRYYEGEYEISQSTFYNLLKKAVIENVVSDEIVEKMAKKSASNSLYSAGRKGQKNSEKYYRHLRKRRMTYMLRKNEAIDLVTKYSRSTFLKEEFCKSYYITARLFDSTLRVAIINNWISDETVAELKAKSLKRNSGQEVIEFWERLEKLRNENKENQG